MSTKKVLITQSNYIPWKGYFDAIKRADVFVLYDDMQFTRRDWRNRNKIKTPQGLQWLTIPVDVKGKFLQKINETVISEAGWNINHWSVLKHNYSRAKCFNDFKDFFEELYLGCTEKSLSQINYRFLKAICEVLGITTEFRLSSEFELRGEKIERLVNLCLDLKATLYLTGPAAKDYLDESLFEKHGIAVEWLDYSGYTPYSQLYGDFEHGVSIVDLLFNEGRDSAKFMKSFNYVGNN